MPLGSRATLVSLFALLSGCAGALRASGDGCSSVSYETGNPARRHRVLAVFRYSKEVDDLAAVKQRACAVGADAVILTRDRAKGRLGAFFRSSATVRVDPFGLVLLPLFLDGVTTGLAEVIDASTREKYPFVATAIRWTEGPTDRVSVASRTSTLRARVNARSQELHAQLEAHPDDEAALAEFLVVSEETDDQAGARTAFERFLRAVPPSPAQRVAWASWLWRHHFGAEALVEARALRGLSPLPRGTSSLLGQLLEDAGQPEEARAELQRALLEDPDDGDAQAALERLGAPR